MKYVLCGLNSSYVHTCLAVRYLHRLLRQSGREAEAVEMTINDRHPAMLRRLYERGGDAYLFSCYIWNVEQVEKLAHELRLLKPSVRLIIGGPEAGFRPGDFLRDGLFNAVMCGEGEDLILPLCEALERGELPNHPSIATAAQPHAVPAVTEELSHIPFVYGEEGSCERIVYYESSRGCPYRCSYCLSANMKTVRTIPVQRAKQELAAMVRGGATLIKFVDRTFNADGDRALELWRFLAKEPATFHFEVCAHLFTQEQLDFLKTVPKGRFQFEIGVQSTNPQTLAAVERRTDLAGCFENLRTLHRQGNIHLHTDLIAGLPYEDFDSFGRSFDDLLPCSDVLQLGFLKVLHGSPIRDRAEEFGLAPSPYPPYEVRRSNWLSYKELCRLKDVEQVVEWYYNSGAFSRSVTLLLKAFASPFACFGELAAQMRKRGFFESPKAQRSLYEPLYRFAQGRCDEPEMQAAVQQDHILYQGLRQAPFLPGQSEMEKRLCKHYLRRHITAGQTAYMGVYAVCGCFILFDERNHTATDVTEQIEKEAEREDI